MEGVAKLDSPVSVSDMANVPLATVALSSVTLPVFVPLMVGTSFTPVTVAVMVLEAVPSYEYTVSESVAVLPEPNACTAALVLSTVYVHAPELKVNVP